MEKSNIIEKGHEFEMMEQLEHQLLEVQRVAGVVQDKLAEAQSVKTLYNRSASSFQYGRLLDCMMEASERAECLTDRLRRFILRNPFSSSLKEEYCLNLVQIHKIRVEYEDCILKAELPVLLPHRKNKYTDYIYKPLFLALQNWCKERQQQGKEIPVYERATVCFIHEYDKKLPGSRIRDHDNIEEKQVVDALGMYFLVSDSGLHLDTYHTTILGERDCTFLFLMEYNQFPKWICKRYHLGIISKNHPIPATGFSTG